MRTIWSSKKRQVVLPKTTGCFAQNDGSLLLHRRGVFFRLFIALSHRGGKTRTNVATERKNTVLFYPFCKTHLSKFGRKPQKTVYFTPKMEQKGGFFPFSLIFRPNIEKKQ